MKKKKVAFLDTLGRTIIGTLASETKDILNVENPVIVHVIPANDKPGQMSVQLIPLFFREFLDDKNQNVTWGFVRSTIAEAKDIQLEPKLIDQYDQVFATLSIPTESGEGNVIKMND